MTDDPARKGELKPDWCPEDVWRLSSEYVATHFLGTSMANAVRESICGAILADRSNRASEPRPVVSHETRSVEANAGSVSQAIEEAGKASLQSAQSLINVLRGKIGDLEWCVRTVLASADNQGQIRIDESGDLAREMRLALGEKPHGQLSEPRPAPEGDVGEAVSLLISELQKAELLRTELSYSSVRIAIHEIFDRAERSALTRLSIRDAVIEECAKVADDMVISRPDDDYQLGQTECASSIVAALRALKGER